MASQLFELRGQLSKRAQVALQIGGGITFVLVWHIIAANHWASSLILPAPLSVITCLPELVNQKHLVANLGYSIYLNFLAYLESVAIALPLGFIIGLLPFFRFSVGPYTTALRYLPLTAAIGIYIQWFGIAATMKVQFLATSITVYLVSSVVFRIKAVDQVYVDTVKTCGASRWQVIRSVFIPDVLSQVWDDIITLLPISWTYIIVVEVINKGDGGIGQVADSAARFSRPDMVFAVLIITILVGFIQDKLANFLGRLMFQYRFGPSRSMQWLQSFMYSDSKPQEVKS